MITTHRNVTYSVYVRTANVHNDRGYMIERLDWPIMKSMYLFILASGDECMEQYPNVFIYSSNVKDDKCCNRARDGMY